MAQDPSIDAARARIQRLVEEIATLSRKEMRSEEYFQQFIARAVQATDARGGAVWLVGQRADAKSEFQLAAQVEMESSLFSTDEQQHANMLRMLAEAVQTKKAVVVPPDPPAPDPGSLQAQLVQMQGQPTQGINRTQYPFFQIPLFLRDQVMGVLQIWLQPYVTASNYTEFTTFLTTLASHVEQHFHSRRLGNLVMENQRLQHVLRFASDISGSLDPQEVARLAANYGRDLIGCERCSVVALDGDRWKVIAISGQEVVEKKSAMVKAMTAFVGAHGQAAPAVKPEAAPAQEGQAQPLQLILLSKKELLARAEANATIPAGGTDAAAAAAASNGHAGGGSELPLAIRRTDEVDLAYFQHSHVVSAAIAPLYDLKHELKGALFAESTTEGFFEGGGGRDTTGSQRLTEWLAIHTGRALAAADDYKSLPLLKTTRSIREAQRALTGKRRARTILTLIIVGTILTLVALYPKMDQVDGNCAIIPSQRAVVVPEVPGRVQKVLAREGSRVTKGQPIAQLDTVRLETELEAARQTRARGLAEADRQRGLGDEASARVAMLESEVATKNVEKLEADIAAAVLRSPIDGVILSKDLELHTGEFVQAGTPFAEVAALDEWELQIEVDEKKIGRLEDRMAEHKPLDVHYILYSQSAHRLDAKLESEQQISAAAHAREKENVFIVTLPNITASERIRSEFRPGLTGRAKVNLKREPLIVWTVKRCIEWFRLKFIR